MIAAPDEHISENKRLGVKLVVDHMFEEHPEAIFVHVYGLEYGFVEVSSGARRVVVLRQHIYLRVRAGAHH